MTPESPGKKWDTLSLLAAVFLIDLLLIWAAWTAIDGDPALLREKLPRWTVVSLHACLSLFLVGCALCIASKRSVLTHVSKSGWIKLFGILVVAAVLVFAVVPKTNRIYYDEHIYENIAQSIAFSGEARMADHAEAENEIYTLFSSHYNKQPIAHPYLLSLFFRIFGVSESTAHLANILVYLVGVFAVFMVGVVLFDSERVGLFAGLFFALTPMVLLWSGAVSAEPLATVSAALAIVAVGFYIKSPSVSSMLLLVSSLGFAANVRPESLLLIAVAYFLLISFRPSELRESRFYWLSLLLLGCVLAELLHLFVMRGESWGSAGEKLSTTGFLDILSVNGPFYFKNERFPLVFSLVAVFGVFFGGNWKSTLGVLLWFLFSWGIFLFFYAGSYNYGADVRFSVVSAAPLAVLAGLGTSRFLDIKVFRKKSSTVGAVVVLAILLSWVWFLPLISRIGNEAFQSRNDVACARSFAEALPSKSLVLTHNPGMWLVWGKNAAQLSIGTTAPARIKEDFFARYPGGVYLHWNYWCNVPNPEQNYFCDAFSGDFVRETVEECAPGDYRYVLYRLQKKV